MTIVREKCRRLHFRFRWVGCAVFLFAAVSAPAAVYDLALNDGSNREERMNLPDSLPVVRGVLIWGNGFESDRRSIATDSEAVAWAESMGFAIVATSMWGTFADGVGYELGLFENELARFAALSGHPEIRTAPWLPIGHSNGGVMSFMLNALRPEKVIALQLSKAGGSAIARPVEAALKTPGILLAGEFDLDIRRNYIRDRYFGNRPRGALWAWVEEQGVEHSEADSAELLRPFMEAMMRARYPVDASPVNGAVQLRPVNEADGWLTDPDSYKNGFAEVAPQAAYTKDKTVAGWLPSRRLAYIFRAFASYNKATGQATLSTGSGPVDWNATLTYTISEPSGSWTVVDFFEGDVLLKRVARAEGAALTVSTNATAPGYSVFHALVTLADGTQRTTMPRRVFVRAGTPQAPGLRTAAASVATAAGGTAMLTPSVTGYPGPSLQWCRNGVELPGGTSATLLLPAVQPVDAGVYTLTATNTMGGVTSEPMVVGLLTTNKVVGEGTELQPANIPHANGNIFDQVLMTGAAATITADTNQVTRISFVDLNDDIVQIEFSGAGTLSLGLDGPTGPATPANYHQPAVAYMKGHAGIVVTGANETTNLTIFTVGRATAFDPTGAFDFLSPASAANHPASNGSPLFQGHAATAYDGVADVAFIAIASANGRFGSLRAADAACFATKGITGIYAPGVQFTGPVFVGDINASATASAMFVIGSSPDTRITGGDLLQANGRPVKVAGVTQLKFTAGANAHGVALPAQVNRAVLLQDGADVTAQVVVNPRP